MLVARDEDGPARWTLASFVDEVASTRWRLSAIATTEALVSRFRTTATSGGAPLTTFEAVSGRLAVDATSVAYAIRWTEIEMDIRLPSWPILVRRRSFEPSDWDPRLHVAIWFG